MVYPISTKKITSYVIFSAVLIATSLTVRFITTSLRKKTHHAELNFKEKSFIARNGVDSKTQEKLDTIFYSLDRRVMQILNGKKTNLTDKEITSYFNASNFSVLAIRRQGKQVGKLVLEHKDLPQSIIKIGCDPKNIRNNLSRVVISEKIHEMIHNPLLRLTHILDIQKKIYHRKNRPLALNDFNYVVISPKIKGVRYDKAPLLDQKTTKKINDDAYIVINYLQPHDADHVVYSLHPENIVITQDNKIAFIDTEMQDVQFRKKVLHLTFDSPNKKEHIFIQKHCVSDETKKILDASFASLNKKLSAFFNGKNEYDSEENLRIDLARHGFTLISRVNPDYFELTHKKLKHYKLLINNNNKEPRKVISSILYNEKINDILNAKTSRKAMISSIDKKLYHRPNTPHALEDKNYIVLSDRINGASYVHMPSSPQLAEKVVATIWDLLTEIEPTSIAEQQKIAFNEFDLASKDSVYITNNNTAVFNNVALTRKDKHNKFLARSFDWLPQPNDKKWFGIALLKHYKA